MADSDATRGNEEANDPTPLDDATSSADGTDEGAATESQSLEDNIDVIAAEAGSFDSIEAQLAEANDRALRTQAELENFRKRSRRELEEQRKYANLPLIADLLPALDNLGRAVDAAEKDENATGLLEGVQMVAGQIQSILEKHNCRRVDATGNEFDPNVHEALAQEPSDEIPAGSVTRELSVGYQLHDRVIRPSQVMVSTGAAAPPANDQ